MMAIHDAYEQHEKDAIHEKLIQADAVSEQSMTATAKQSLLATKLVAPVINPQHNSRSWTTDVPDPWAAGMQSSVLPRPSNL